MEIIKIPQSECGQVATSHIKSGEHDIGYIVIETPIAIVHKKSQVDEAVCNELGYTIYESYNNGGTILGNKGDIMFSHVAEPDNRWLFRFAGCFANWLKDKGLNAEHVDNDILVGGYKVCGLCITRYGRIDFSSAFIGINTNLDHIKAICKKPMVKVPKGLSEYGITTEEVEQWFIEFCKGDE